MTNPVPFLRHWFDGCKGAVQLVALDPDKKRGRLLYFVRPPFDWDAAAAWAREQSEAGFNVYFAACTQPPDATTDRTDASAYEYLASSRTSTT